MEGGVAPFSSAMAPSSTYILIIVSQPVTEKDKDTILDRLKKGLLSWDVESTGCDLNGLEAVCSSISPKHLDDTDVLIQHSTESLGVEVLVNPTVSTLKQCVKNLLSTSTGHKHLIHTGYTFAGSGSWILQNGTFSFDDFLEIFQQADVQSQKRCNIHIHCSEVGHWNSASFAKDIFTKVASVAFNPPEKVQCVPGSEHLVNCLKKVLNSQDLEEMMEASSLVGNIRFNRPTLYMFPAGQGDCALFGINGFNMLIDGGFNRKPCSWEFIRHLDRLDAVLVTRLCENNVCGMSTLMKRKSVNNTYPQIGYVFCNIPENKTPSPKEETAKDDLIVSVVNEGHNFTQTLNELKLKPHQCWRDLAVEPFVLYHKVGHGTLEMHVLSPPKDSKEMKDFIAEWSSFKETFSSTKSGLKGKALDTAIPLSHATSVCAVLIWRPADPKDTITRILFPGSAPQNKIFESLERLKTLDVLSHPVVTKASLSVITKTVSHKVEKSVSRTTVPNRRNTASPAPSVNSVASRNGDSGGHKTETKEVKKIIKDVVKKEVKKEVKRETVLKEKKEVKTDTITKRDAKKDIAPKEIKKEVKKIVKKDIKEMKPVIDKKPEMKSTVKKETTAVSKTVNEVKKASSTTLKKSLPITKKDVKPTTVTKTTEIRKSAPTKLSDIKTAKDVSNKKTSEIKAVAKTKPKSAPSTPKTAAAKTKPVAVPKPGTKVTKAVAASSIVASAVAVTAAAFELNEKKEEIVDEVEAEVPDVRESEISVEPKELEVVEKTEEEVVVSPLPPEALSPTPSESVSLTPSDTLSSAPLETVSPTPPLANEPISTEEKEVNEIKDIEQDMPSETEIADEVVDEEVAHEGDKESDNVNEIEAQLARLQQNSDAMSTSFVGSKDADASEIETEIIAAGSSAFETQAVEPEIPATEVCGTVEKPIEKEEGYIFESKEMNVDDQLAQMSMEGSFCAGGGYEVEEHVETHGDLDEENTKTEHSIEGVEAAYETNTVEQNEEDLKYTEKEAFLQNYEQIDRDHEMKISSHETDDIDEVATSKTEDFNLESQETEKNYSANATETELQDTQEYSCLKTEDLTEVQEKEIISDEAPKYESSMVHKDVDEHYLEEQYDQEPELEALKETIGRATNEDYEISRNIINDADMQETSVDEPEEIVRKESVVSITLNDEDLEDNYMNQLRRKSGTESEDDVDLHQYMLSKEKNILDHEKLSARQEDSDDEDVVKSPTPHAIVDYEDNMDNLIAGNTDTLSGGNHEVVEEKDLYPSEKQDFDEKDHDSTEDQDVDDGEMIRHPTPPEMKYSEEEMRDPIGPHFITTPGLKPQGAGITEQPLYEEEDEEASDRSESPVVEQPVFGSVVAADFPELVTVSGGTTPSEPQSPKAGFDAKKFGAETGIMEALSEHDLSESSTHSPLCHDGTTFDLPVTTDKLPEDQQILDDKYEQVQDENLKERQNITDHEKDTHQIEHSALDKEQIPLPSRTICDAPSDDESYSQNEKSETRSEKSDDDDEKSNTRHDDKSDMHDDKSDNQYDGKSDVMDDERRSDIHEDDRTDSHHDDKHDYYDEKRSGGAHDIQESDKTETLGYEASYDSETLKSVSYQQSEFHSEYHSDAIAIEKKTEEAFGYDESHGLDRKDGIQSFQTDDFHSTDSFSHDDKDSTSVTKDGHFDTLQMQDEHTDDYKNSIVDEDKFNIPSGFHDEEEPRVPDSHTYSDNTQFTDNSNIYGAVGTAIDDHLQFESEQKQTEPAVPASGFGCEDNFAEQESYDIKTTEISTAPVGYESDKDEYSSKITDFTGDDAVIEEHMEKLEEHNQFVATKEEFKESAIPHPVDTFSTVENENLEIPGVPPSKVTELTENIEDYGISYSETSSSRVPEEYEISSHVSESSHFDDTNYNYVSQRSETFGMNQNYEASAYTHEICTTQSNFEQTLPGGSNYGEAIESAEYESEIPDAASLNFPHTEPGFSDHNVEGTGIHFDERTFHEKSQAEEVHTTTTTTGYTQESNTSEAVFEADSGLSLNEGKESSFSRLNGKDQACFSQISEYSEQYTSQIESSQFRETEYSASQQESSYIINSRFHSDSPEDNVMRSDSSPDVPYPPSSIDPLSSLKTTKVDESQDFRQTKEEYLNINLPQAAVVPTSPNNKSHNAIRDDPYGESSEDDDSSSVPGTVSPYAYTNKAYAKEEEDIDGNHIYKESTFEKNSEISKQVEFDGNNPQSVTTTQQVEYSQGYQEREYTGSTNYDFHLEEWEKPMGLPTPPESTKTVVKKTDKLASKPLGKSAVDSNGKAPSVASKLSSPLKKPKPKTTKESSSTPVYVDLAYVPHHGDPHYCDVEFFKKIRARYYVFSGINPSKEVLNALLEAKKTWKEEMEVTIIPTYETDTLGYWMAQNQDDLATYSIEVAPSASRCTVNLQDHETSCAAYRLEF